MTKPISKKTKAAQAVAKRVALLWEKIEVRPEDLSRHPSITPILIKSLGSILKTIEYLRGSDAKEALEFIRLWDLSSEPAKLILPFEAFCLAAKCTPKKMMGIIAEAVVEQEHTVTELLVASAHPDIVKVTIDQAKTEKGYSDRETIHKNRGFLPTPKTQQFNNFGNMDNRRQISNISVGSLQEDDDEISSVQEAFNEQRQLAGPTPIDFVDVVAESEEE